MAAIEVSAVKLSAVSVVNPNDYYTLWGNAGVGPRLWFGKRPDDFFTKTHGTRTFNVWYRAWHDGRYSEQRFLIELLGYPEHGYGRYSVVRTIPRKLYQDVQYRNKVLDSMLEEAYGHKYMRRVKGGSHNA